MADPIQDAVNLLRSIHLFFDLSDEQLRQVVQLFQVEQVPKGQMLIVQGEVGDRFYILLEGSVRVVRQMRRGERELARLVRGDYFGEEALLYRVRRTASVLAAEPSTVLWLDQRAFQRLTQMVPHLKERFAVVVESRRLSRQMAFQWLGPDEVIYLLARKHQTVLFTELVGPALIMTVGTLIMALYLLTGAIIPLLVGGVILLGGLGLAIWRWVDWGNDYYLMTNHRVVWLEKVVGFYESRTEAPLRTVLSISVSTDQLGRLLNYGDVIVRTYTGKIVLRHVSHPDRMREFMEEHWNRIRRQIKADESAAMDNAIRKKLGLPVRTAYQEPAPPPPPPTPTTRPGWATLLINRLFRTRYEEEGAIVFRKHWFILVRNIWWAILLMLASLVFLSAHLTGWLTWFSLRSALAISLTGLVVGLVVGGYRYLDWSNDIYRVTADHIVDVDRTPLGREQLNSAPLENILSMDYERRGLLGLLLNFGPVKIRIGATHFVFEDVPDPAGVQNEIYRRMEAQRRRKERAAAEKERERLAEWLAVYHRHAEEYRRLREAEQQAQEEEEQE